jgi:hypothetical protein
VRVLRHAAKLLALAALAGTCTGHPASRVLPPPPCPSSEPIPASATIPQAKNELVPFSATILRLCNYQSLRTQLGSELAGTCLDTNAAEVQGYELQLNALAPFPPGTINACPFDDGSALVATFSGDKQTVVIHASLGGCRVVTNGPYAAAWGPVVDQLVSRTQA